MLNVERLEITLFESTKACKAFLNIGAGGRNRTDMRLPPRDCELYGGHVGAYGTAGLWGVFASPVAGALRAPPNFPISVLR